MKKLVDIFKEIGHFGSDIGCNDKNGTHTYCETYDKLFEPFQKGCTMMEIGLAMGDSIKLWDQYFIKSKIVGVDISIVFEKQKYNNRVHLIEYNATQLGFLDTIKDYTFDIVIDDGEHTEQSQITTFNLLKHKINKGGIYIIEDILSPDQSLPRLTKMHDNCEVVDMRHINGRFDNMLLIYRF